MKTAIVYYSMSGNTAYVADRLKEQLGSEVDLIEIKPVKAFPDSGFKKFLWGGKSAVMAQKPKLQPYTFDAEKYDQIIIGFPVWAGNVTPPIRTFVRDNDLREKKVAVFACESGAGAEKAFGKLKEALGRSSLEAELILIDPKDKPSGENLQKIEEFCSALSE